MRVVRLVDDWNGYRVAMPDAAAADDDDAGGRTQSFIRACVVRACESGRIGWLGLTRTSHIEIHFEVWPADDDEWCECSCSSWREI